MSLKLNLRLLHHVMLYDFYTHYSHVITLHLLLYLLITLLINIILASFLLYMLLITPSSTLPLILLYIAYLFCNKPRLLTSVWLSLPVACTSVAED